MALLLAGLVRYSQRISTKNPTWLPARRVLNERLLISKHPLKEFATMTSLLQSMRLSNSFFDSTEPLMLPAIPTSSVADSELDIVGCTAIKLEKKLWPSKPDAITDVLVVCLTVCGRRRNRKPEQHRHAQVLKQFDSGRIQSGLHGRQEEHSRLETLNQRLTLSAKTTLPPNHYYKFLEQIIQFWESMKDEIALRQSGVNNEKTYIQIRSRPVGLAPFFTLLKAEICPESDSDAVIDAHLDRLQELVSIVVGLQNDLVGLERDLASLETCNLISFKARTNPGSSMAQAVGEVVRLHNQQILHAVEAFGEVLERCEKKSGYTLVAHSMLGLIDRSSSRYAVSNSVTPYRSRQVVNRRVAVSAAFLASAFHCRLILMISCRLLSHSLYCASLILLHFA
ncbi:hypothetical protein KC367_g11 [Hortaea werneckii]|nr:hypothetical protein KC367_g11 [Hortaea werneckii]